MLEGTAQMVLLPRRTSLVLGNNDYCKAIKDGKSAKQKKAEKMKLKGFGYRDYFRKSVL